MTANPTLQTIICCLCWKEEILQFGGPGSVKMSSRHVVNAPSTRELYCRTQTHHFFAGINAVAKIQLEAG